MRRRWILLVELLLLAGVVAWAALSLVDFSYRPDGSTDLKAALKGARDRVFVWQKPEDGTYWYYVRYDDGRSEYLSPEEFTRRYLIDRRNRGGIERVLNVTSWVGLLWVGMGLLGQVLFTGRMVVQWLVSERAKRSTVPPVFWWMSLLGATMLLMYFLWRKDPVGVLGQTFGWFIYIRNLYLIYAKPTDASPLPASAVSPPPEPQRETDSA